MALSASQLSDFAPFVRGYLLAADWAGKKPSQEVNGRVPGLREADLGALYDAFRALPRESRHAMRITWAKRQPRERLDDSSNLHSSWLIEMLEDESAATLLIALGETQPDLGRDALRAIWPRLKPTTGNEVGDTTPLSPAWAGAFRRYLYARFTHMTASPARTHSLALLLKLDAQQLWLLAQELGKATIVQASKAGPRELDILLDQLPLDQAARFRRLLGWGPASPSLRLGQQPGAGPLPGMPPSVEATASGPHPLPQVDRPMNAHSPRIPSSTHPGSSGDREDWQRALGHIRTVLPLTETEGNIVGLIGLRILSSVLSTVSRDICLQLAQRMGRSIARYLIQWRDECSPANEDAQEITARIESILVQYQVRSGDS